MAFQTSENSPTTARPVIAKHWAGNELREHVSDSMPSHRTFVHDRGLAADESGLFPLKCDIQLVNVPLVH